MQIQLISIRLERPFTDAEVERQLKHLQDVYHSFEKIDDPDHVAEMGDVVSAAPCPAGAAAAPCTPEGPHGRS